MTTIIGSMNVLGFTALAAFTFPAAAHDFQLTGDTGAQIELKTEAIIRVRQMTESERELHHANTRVDYAFTVFAKELPDAVVQSVTTSPDGLKTLGKLILPNTWPVWFNGEHAEGPIPVPAALKNNGIQSALKIGDSIQYVRNSPQEVLDVITTHHGKGLPLSSEANAPVEERSISTPLAPKRIWDADVPELRVAE